MAAEPYRSSTALQSLRPSRIASAAFATAAGSAPAADGHSHEQNAAAPGAAAAAHASGGESAPNEARYWAAKYAFGPARLIPSSKKETAPKKASFTTTANSAVACLTFGPRGGGGTGAGAGSFHPLAVVGGPRAAIYGPGPQCSLARTLSGQAGANSDEPDLFGGKSSGQNEIKADRNVGTGGQPAHAASYRRDGRLLAIGTDGGFVRVCDAKSRATLRTFGGRGGGGGANAGGVHPVRSVVWLRDGRSVVSGGDDGVVRLWELSGGTGGGKAGDAKGDGVGLGSPSTKPRLSLRGHGDSVRAVLVIRTKKLQADATGGGAGGAMNLAISGSYDHTVRVWDIDPFSESSTAGGDGVAEDRCLSILDHGSPVEALLLLPPCPATAAPRIASAGGISVKVWNPLTGELLATVETMHSKTITSLVLVNIVRNVGESDDNAKRTNLRLLTAGLDGLVRIHSADCLLLPPTEGTKLAFPFLHGARTPHPVTALAVSPDNARLVVGHSTGLVTVRQRAKLVRQGVSSKKRKAGPRAGTYAYFVRGADASADADDHVVIMERKKKLKSYDVLLRQFRYGDAVDEALASRQPDAVVAVLEELSKRRGLTQALSNRDEETLEPLLAFTARYVSKPRYSSVLAGVAEMLCDIYGAYVGQSEVVDECFEKLRRGVREECRVRRTCAGLVGMIDAVVWRAAAAEGEEEAEAEEREER